MKPVRIALGRHMFERGPARDRLRGIAGNAGWHLDRDVGADSSSNRLHGSQRHSGSGMGDDWRVRPGRLVLGRRFGSSIDYVNGVTHRERVYRLAEKCCGRGVRGYPGLAVGPNGTVWGVLNHTLVELNSNSGRYLDDDSAQSTSRRGEPSMDFKTSQNSADLVRSPAVRQAEPSSRSGSSGPMPSRSIASAMEAPCAPLDDPPAQGYFALDVGSSRTERSAWAWNALAPIPSPRSTSFIRAVIRLRSESPMASAWSRTVTGSSSATIARSSSPKRVGQVVTGRLQAAGGNRWTVNAADGGPNRLSFCPAA